jgi:hypothetical protein
LIVALMIDPQAVALHATPPPPPAGGVARATRAPPPETDAVASGASIGLPHSALVTALSLGPSVIVDAGTLPRLTYGAGARVGVRFGASALELGVLASAAERAAIAATTVSVRVAVGLSRRESGPLRARRVRRGRAHPGERHRLRRELELR